MGKQKGGILGVSTAELNLHLHPRHWALRRAHQSRLSARGYVGHLGTHSRLHKRVSSSVMTSLTRIQYVRQGAPDTFEHTLLRERPIHYVCLPALGTRHAHHNIYKDAFRPFTLSCPMSQSHPHSRGRSRSAPHSQ